MHTIHKEYLLSLITFFPQLLPLIDLPTTLEWIYVSGQNISFMNPHPLFKIKLYCKYHLTGVIADMEAKARHSLESFTQGTVSLILHAKMD